MGGIDLITLTFINVHFLSTHFPAFIVCNDWDVRPFAFHFNSTAATGAAPIAFCSTFIASAIGCFGTGVAVADADSCSVHRARSMGQILCIVLFLPFGDREVVPLPACNAVLVGDAFVVVRHRQSRIHCLNCSLLLTRWCKMQRGGVSVRCRPPNRGRPA